MTAEMVKAIDVHIGIFNERISMHAIACHLQTAFVSLGGKKDILHSYIPTFHQETKGNIWNDECNEKGLRMQSPHKYVKEEKYMHELCHSFNISYLRIPGISVTCKHDLSFSYLLSINQSRKLSP